MKIFLKNAETGLNPVSLIFILISCIIQSCSDTHLINSVQYRALTEETFNKRKELAANRDSVLFSVFKQKLSNEQAEALVYLYAYMPLSDLADYDGSFFLANVNISLKAKRESKWGEDVPEDVFLHYVLPYRINNENLDSFRIAYYDELVSRIKGKDLTDAALEINHWCHEKVSYQPADIRTSAPMSTILSARGRCGEESTFTVAALRTVGIPARQVYTPRWAHSDDNHAWVEIWVNGTWKYMGACEPEPVTDRGWFTEPARRAMLVHTKSFGAFSGNEQIINKYPYYSDINNLAKYATTKKIFVKVLDSDNKPVKNAEVEYQLYNYSEFYPLADVPSDDNGISQFVTGLGDLLIWAHKGDNFDFRKISVAETDTLTLELSSDFHEKTNTDLDLDVPVVHSPLQGPAQVLIDENALRINNENSIRQKYIDSWIKPADSKQLAFALKIDTVRARNILERSMGNYKEITTLLKETPDSLRQLAVSLLEIIPDKDLRDSKCSILSDHLINCIHYGKNVTQADYMFFVEYILNPRIANEALVPWRHYFLNELPSQIKLKGPLYPEFIVQYLNDNIKIADEENYYNTPLTPIGVYELKVSDKASRAICFVAICRTFGIASRLEPGSNVPQFYTNNRWNDVYFSDQKKPDLNKAFLKLRSGDKKPVPEYYIHFTIARFEGGRYNTLEYDYNKKITDFKEELSLTPGHYMLVTGNRISDSKILSNISFFDLAANEHKTLDVKIRKDLSEKKILGKIDLLKFNTFFKNNKTSQSCSTGKGSVFIWIEPDKEPTRHIFNDLPLLKTELDEWGGTFLFLSDSLAEPGSAFTGKIKGLPANSSFVADNNRNLLKDCMKYNDTAEINLPVVIVTDKDGNILFESTGYRIGIGEQILKYVK